MYYTHSVPLNVQQESDTSSINPLVMRAFVSGPPRYHSAIIRVREQFVVSEQSSGFYGDSVTEFRILR